MHLSKASLDSRLLDKVRFKSSGVAKFLSFVCLLFLLFSCASGGSSQLSPILPQQSVATETDQRIRFESFTNVMASPWGDISVEYSMSSFSPSSQWPSNDKYRIEDYGFLRVTSVGTHPGDASNPDEVSQAGPYLTNGQWFEANLNNDAHTDLIYVGTNFVIEILFYRI